MGTPTEEANKTSLFRDIREKLSSDLVIWVNSSCQLMLPTSSRASSPAAAIFYCLFSLEWLQISSKRTTLLYFESNYIVLVPHHCLTNDYYSIHQNAKSKGHNCLILSFL